MADSKVWISDQWQYDDGTKKPNHGTGSRWRVQWYEDADGKRSMRSKNFRKKSDAEAFQTKTENALREDSYVSTDVAALTVADAAEAWLASKKKQKPSALARYRDAIENYVIPRWGTTRLSAVKR